MGDKDDIFEDEELVDEIARGRRYLEQIDDFLRIQKVKAFLLLLSTIALFMIVAGGALWQFLYSLRTLSYEERAVAASVTLFASFFLFEAIGAAINSFSLLIRGSRVRKNQDDIIIVAEKALYDGP